MSRVKKKFEGLGWKKKELNKTKYVIGVMYLGMGGGQPKGTGSGQVVWR